MERLPGFRDFYPEPLPHADTWSADARQFIFDQWRETAKRYNFREYDGPPLEPLELFTTKSGEEIVGQARDVQRRVLFRCGDVIGRAIIIDYSETSSTFFYMRDEVRRIADGLWLGRSYYRKGPRGKYVLTFAMDFTASPRR